VKHGVVAAGDPQSAEAGALLLRAGGNAVDAAVATAFAAFVCELPLCSPLGGGAMLVELANGDAHAIDMFARAPGLGGPKPTTMDFKNVEVSFGAATQVFHVGRASAAVPLALPGLLEVHRRWGALPLDAVVAPAVALGVDGFTLGPGVAYAFEVLTPIVELTPECRALYATPSGPLGVHGERLANRDLAGSLEALGRSPDALRDFFAAFAREFGPERGGLVTQRDIEEARVAHVTPVHAKHGAVPSTWRAKGPTPAARRGPLRRGCHAARRPPPTSTRARWFTSTPTGSLGAGSSRSSTLARSARTLPPPPLL
jgi:gamma-glutamyltranspeptidase/glutathione hydrolase